MSNGETFHYIFYCRFPHYYYTDDRHRGMENKYFYTFHLLVKICVLICRELCSQKNLLRKTCYAEVGFRLILSSLSLSFVSSLKHISTMFACWEKKGGNILAYDKHGLCSLSPTKKTGSARHGRKFHVE